MTLRDIQGLDKCLGRKSTPDLTDTELWAMLESEFPGLMHRLHEHRGPGERVYVPVRVEQQMDKAMRMDDGVMSLRTLAVVAEVSVRTAWVARKSRV